MVSKEELGFGIDVNIGGKDYILIENCYGDWWIACEKKVGTEVELLLIKYNPFPVES